MTEPLEVVVARVEQRLIAVERDVRDMKSRRPSWPSVVSALVATGTLFIVLMQII
ncbi:MAG: hypothetical protein WBA87_09295 [Microbacterium sp.]